MNGNFFIQEVTGKVVPVAVMNQAGAPGGGHYRCTVTVINESQVLSYLAFWENLAAGGSGGSQIGAIGAGAPSGGSNPPITSTQLRM